MRAAPENAFRLPNEKDVAVAIAAGGGAQMRPLVEDTPRRSAPIRTIPT